VKNIGVIDIGSNSVRLIVVQVGPGPSFQIIDTIKNSVRLGQDLGQDNDLNAIRVRTAVDTLRYFKGMCSAYGVELIMAVATAAVRRAPNREQFLSLAMGELDLDVRVLSGEEEAFYDYLGVVNSIDVDDGLIMDIGGSSTELVLVKDRNFLEYASIPFGSINLTEQYSALAVKYGRPGGPFRDFLWKIFNNIPWLTRAAGYPLIGIGGAMRNIGKIDRKKIGYPLDIAHNYRLTNLDLSAIYHTVNNTNLSQGKRIKGLSKDRADIFIGAVAAIKLTADYCRTQDLYVSGSGLREGLIYEYLLGADNLADNPLDFSLNSALTRFGLHKEHAFHVWRLLDGLFKQLAPICKTESHPHKVIRTAALLHDAGTNISYYDHHRHSFYLILNSNIQGISHKELLMSAFVAALYRRDDVRVNANGYSLILNDADMALIRQLGVLLKICESLDRGLQCNVKEVRCEIDQERVVMKLAARDDAQLEIEEAMDSCAVFERVFGKKLLII
jgi:exopolyphosphatase/guanosine-5'-triphosphate,3'-diphosphate pyrophosphatase